MRSFDFTPFARSTIGFDHLFDQLANQASELTDHYPPYDIIRTGEDAFRINLAVAGFSPGEITVTAQQNLLTVAGRRSEGAPRQFIYQGISARPFERRFNLADYVEVESATLENGLLQINLVRRLPEAMKPRRIEITQAGAAPEQNRTLTSVKAA